MRILIVDNSLATRRMIAHSLRQAAVEDWDTSEASSANEALAVMKMDPPDLILTDLDMPEMDGLEMVELMRMAGIETPVGLITAFDAAETREEAQNVGIRFVLGKPFDQLTLHKAVKMINDELAAARTA